MVVATRISPAEFLAITMPDRPEPELVAGEVQERGLPNHIHSFLQVQLGALLRLVAMRLGFSVHSEIRVQLGEEDFRTIDLAVFASFPALVPQHPPLVAIEILSPGDRYAAVMRKCRDYEAWGVAEIWLVDPEARAVSRYSNGTLEARESMELPALAANLPSAEIFAGLPVQ